MLPAEAIEAAREDLRERLRSPKPGLADQQRKRLETRLVQLKKLVSWGHMEDAEYLSEREAVERELTALPEKDGGLDLFDRHRRIAETMTEAIGTATPEQQREFVELLVERVIVIDRYVAGIEWKPGAEQFMAATGVLVRARPAGLEPTTFRSAT